MEFIKKFAKEISVFGLVIVIFLGLFVYRQATYATYSTKTKSEMTSMVKDKKDMIVVVGSSSDTSVTSYQEVMEKFCTKNRKYKLYYVDADASYIKKTFNVAATAPCTLIVKNGKVKTHKSGALQYYYLLDFVKENF